MRATAAVLPAAVTLTPGGDAIVRSSLFTPDGSDVVVDWHGTHLRVRTHGSRHGSATPSPSHITDAVVYPQAVEDAPEREAVMSA